MNDNIFIEKFEKKTDSDLLNILENKDNYTNEALTAAVHTLKNRDYKSELLESVERELKNELENTISQNQSEIPNNHFEEFENHSNLPELYSKRVIMAFSVIFSTIFGAVLLAQNMSKMDNKTGRNQVLIFAIVYTIINVIIVNSFSIGANLSLVFNITGGLILSEYFWNRNFGLSIKYKNKSWIKPAIISLLITIPLVLAAIYGDPNALK